MIQVLSWCGAHNSEQYKKQPKRTFSPHYHMRRRCSFWLLFSPTSITDPVAGYLFICLAPPCLGFALNLKHTFPFHSNPFFPLYYFAVCSNLIMSVIWSFDQSWFLASRCCHWCSYRSLHTPGVWVPHQLKLTGRRFTGTLGTRLEMGSIHSISLCYGTTIGTGLQLKKAMRFPGSGILYTDLLIDKTTKVDGRRRGLYVRRPIFISILHIC